MRPSRLPPCVPLLHHHLSLSWGSPSIKTHTLSLHEKDKTEALVDLLLSQVVPEEPKEEEQISRGHFSGSLALFHAVWRERKSLIAGRSKTTTTSQRDHIPFLRWTNRETQRHAVGVISAIVQRSSKALPSLSSLDQGRLSFKSIVDKHGPKLFRFLTTEAIALTLSIFGSSFSAVSETFHDHVATIKVHTSLHTLLFSSLFLS